MNENELKICKYCGTEAESLDQKYCTNCGAVLGEQSYTGYNTVDPSLEGRYDASAKNGQTANKPLGMKWYMFLVSFYLMFNAIISVVNSFMYFTGNYVTIYDMTPAEYYAEYGAAMKAIDVAYGVILIGEALYLFLTRVRLMKFRKNAPALFLAFYVFNLLLNVAYYIAPIYISGNTLTMNDTSYLTSLVIVYTVFIILNAIYFKKRAFLFKN